MCAFNLSTFHMNESILAQASTLNRNNNIINNINNKIKTLIKKYHQIKMCLTTHAPSTCSHNQQQSVTISVMRCAEDNSSET